MKDQDNKIFKLRAREKTANVVCYIYYLLCAIPYIYLLIGQPFVCIASSFVIALLGGLFILLAGWLRADSGKLNWAIYLAFAPGLIMFILAPFIFLQRVFDIMNNS